MVYFMAYALPDLTGNMALSLYAKGTPYPRSLQPGRVLLRVGVHSRRLVRQRCYHNGNNSWVLTKLLPASHRTYICNLHAPIDGHDKSNPNCWSA